MQAFQIQDVKGFMAKLLIGNAFDAFLLSEASITTFCTFSIDGRFRGDFFAEEKQDESEKELSARDLARWEQVRPFCLSLIKGKRTPLGLKIVFRLAENNVERLLSQSGLPLPPADVEGLYLNIRYDGTSLTCVTGTSLKVFTLDRTLEHTWDQMVGAFLKKQDIAWESR